MTTKIVTYGQLGRYALAFSEGYLNLLIVEGRAGLGKTTAIREATDGRAKVIQGQVSALALYMELYRHRDQPIVIDDVDRLYADPACVRLLKLVCQTEPVKVVEWNTTTQLLDAEDIPRKFTTSSPVCIIANAFRTTNADVKAIIDRGVSISFDPSAQELHAHVCTWFDDSEVLNFIGEHLSHISEPSQRHYLVAQSLRKAKLDWRGALLSTWGVDPRVVALRHVFREEGLKSQSDRCREWTSMTGSDRATFYRLLGDHPEIATLRQYTRSNRRNDSPSAPNNEAVRPKRKGNGPEPKGSDSPINPVEVAP